MTDKAATDAAAAASTADGKAVAAQTAANNAQTTANSKGKTIIQNAAPVAADQLAQNLWIDTTGGANTPKRWSGSAWVVVTDKAATDAAAAAVAAKNAADAAQAKADTAFTNAAAAATAAGQAQTTANAKNRVWYTNTAPPGTGHKIDDVWFDGANGNRINTWSGSAWVVRQMGTNAIANLAITNALIANLDAAKITTGFIAAARIAAKTITADKLLISTPHNLIPNGSGEDGGAIGWATGLGWDVTDKPTGLPGSFTIAKGLGGGTHSFANVGYTAIEASTEYLFEIWMKADVPNSLFYLSFHAQDNTDQTPRFVTTGLPGTGVTALPFGATYPVSAVILPTVWTKYRGVVKTGPTVTGFRLASYWPNHSSGAEKNAAIKLAGLRLSKRSGGELIVDGAIQARHVTMDTGFADKFWANEGNFGKIAVDHVTTNFGENLNISASGTIQMMAGRQDAQDEAINQAQSTADNAAATAQEGVTTAGVAEAKADGAAGAALVAQTLANQVNTELNLHKTVFIVDESGAIIAAVDRSNELRMRSTYIAMAQNGVEVTRWEGNRMIVNEAVLTKARIASISIEPYTNNSTAIRQI